ncbi:MAG: lactonase family protein [Caldilineaceae bacterium]
MAETEGDLMRVYVGTYTRREPHVEGKSTGIHVLRFNASAGSLTPERVIGDIDNPSYLAIHPSGRALYAISEVGDFEGRAEGGVFAYGLDADSGEATLLNTRSTKGRGPAYISVDADGKNVLIANYGGGSLSVLPIRQDMSLNTTSEFIQHEGSSVNPQRQEAPHAHCIVLDRENRYALAADLGMDKVMIYRYGSETGSLSANPDQPWARTKSGAGPRHIAFHPSQRTVYVINELDSTLVTYRYDAEKGSMTEVQNVSTLPEEFDGRNYPADIHVHPSGRFVYGSNRGHDSIAAYAVDDSTGELELIEIVSSGGECPRGFALAPSGEFALVANQDSDNLVVFGIDLETGKLSPTGIDVEIPTPVCVKMWPK